jgi:hypothetical protein
MAVSPGVAEWLRSRDLAPLGRAALADSDQPLASALTCEALGAAAANMAHLARLSHVERRFAAEEIDLVLLKGAAIADGTYADPSLRPMTDVDIWVRTGDMARAAATLIDAGYRQEPGLAHRPEALQRRSGGELVFRASTGTTGLIELHFSPFAGWWIQRTACPDLAAVWQRSVPMGANRHARCLAPEDAVLQTAFHVVVNQFGQAPLRGLMDLAVLARVRPIDWDEVADRARLWRLAHATWIALAIADRLIGLPGSETALARLRPGRSRRWVLDALVSPESLLAGRDLTGRQLRHPFMLSIVDRRRDGARLVGRAIWPETWWLTARHGRATSRYRHLRELLRRGEV